MERQSPPDNTLLLAACVGRGLPDRRGRKTGACPRARPSLGAAADVQGDSAPAAGQQASLGTRPSATALACPARHAAQLGRSRADHPLAANETHAGCVPRLADQAHKSRDPRRKTDSNGGWQCTQPTLRVRRRGPTASAAFRPEFAAGQGANLNCLILDISARESLSAGAAGSATVQVNWPYIVESVVAMCPSNDCASGAAGSLPTVSSSSPSSYARAGEDAAMATFRSCYNHDPPKQARVPARCALAPQPRALQPQPLRYSPSEEPELRALGPPVFPPAMQTQVALTDALPRPGPIRERRRTPTQVTTGDAPPRHTTRVELAAPRGCLKNHLTW